MGSAVYFMKCGDYIKIGYSKDDVKGRRSSMQTGSPHRIRLIATVPCVSDGHARTVEGRFHTLFRDYQQSGEWFWYRPIERYLHIRPEDRLLYIRDFCNACEVNGINEYVKDLFMLAEMPIKMEGRHDIPAEARNRASL